MCTSTHALLKSAPGGVCVVIIAARETVPVPIVQEAEWAPGPV
jgi:hypothetical protein